MLRVYGDALTMQIDYLADIQIKCRGSSLGCYCIKKDSDKP